VPTGWADYTYPITIDAVSVGVLPFDIRITEVTAGVTFDVHITSVDTGVTFNVNIAEVATGVTFNVNISSVSTGVTFNVNIAEVATGVTFNVHIESATTFTVNIQTSAGANIVIDKLTTEAYTEDRRILSNNGATPSIMAPGYQYYFGKFFPRGCRGYINTIEVYCGNSDTTDHTLYIYISPQPGMGRVISASLTVSAGTSNSWRSVSIQRFWNYDSMFIYIIGDSTNYPTVGYDTGTPYDQVNSSDETTWTPQTRRLWIRVNMTGETVGDLPVSGTVDTILVPHSASKFENTGTSISAGTETELLSISGAGYCDLIILQSAESNYPQHTMFKVYCDGELADAFSPSTLYQYGMSALSRPYCLLKYDTTASTGICNIMVTQRFEFTRQLRVTAYNGSASAYCTAKAVANLIT